MSRVRRTHTYGAKGCTRVSAWQYSSGPRSTIGGGSRASTSSSAAAATDGVDSVLLGRIMLRRCTLLLQLPRVYYTTTTNTTTRRDSVTISIATMTLVFAILVAFVSVVGCHTCKYTIYITHNNNYCYISLILSVCGVIIFYIVVNNYYTVVYVRYTVVMFYCRALTVFKTVQQLSTGQQNNIIYFIL